MKNETTEYKLTAKRVNEVFNNCLFREDEPHDNFIKADGIQISVGFHPERLDINADEIKLMLGQLDDNFKSKAGGGWTFLNMCNDRHGRQWTDFHRTMEQLVLLGIGIKAVSYLMPKEMWPALPGGMPYIVIDI